MKKAISHFLLTVFMAVVSFSSSYAEDAVPAPSQNQENEISELLPKAKTEKSLAAPTYEQLTYPNLFRLAWSMNAFEDHGDETLDTYLMITECNLYKKFYENEFEWEKVRTAARKYLAQYGGSKTSYYEYVQPIIIGRYDYDLEGFPVDKPESYTSLKVLQMANYDSGETSCGRFQINTKQFPPSAVLNLISPFTFTFVSVPRSEAEAYLSWRSKNKLNDNKEGRVAYIKYRVRIDKFIDRRLMDGWNTFVFDGRLMQIDVFADKGLIMPLYTQLF